MRQKNARDYKRWKLGFGLGAMTVDPPPAIDSNV
jgi:hypothetical protein